MNVCQFLYVKFREFFIEYPLKNNETTSVVEKPLKNNETIIVIEKYVSFNEPYDTSTKRCGCMML